MTTDDSDKLSNLRTALAAHLEKLPQDAPTRSMVAALEARIKDFDDADKLAMKEQSTYRYYGRLALWSMLGGTLIGALVLLPIDQYIEGWPRKVIEGLQTCALGLTLMLLGWVSLRQQVGRWLRARATAERIRADVFGQIVRFGAESKDYLAAALACFKDAHLDWQLDFFKKRGPEHSKAAGLANRYRVVGYLLMAVPILWVIAGIIIFLAETLHLSWPPLTEWAHWLTPDERGRWQLGLQTMASGMLAFAGARSFMDQDDRNASCYALAEEMLEELRREDLPAAEQAAREGNVEVVRTFCDKVQDVLNAEHLAWSFRPRRSHVGPPGPDVV